MDKRILKTRRALGDALIQLLQEYPFYQITIRQITERAHVAYSTFFRNFESSEALLLAHLNQFIHEIEALNNDVPDDSFRDASRKRAKAIFEHVGNNQAMYRVLLSISVIRPTLDTFKQNLVSSYVEMLQPYETQMLEATPPLSLAVHHTVAELFTMMEWWLAQDSAIDAEIMARYYEQLVTFPTWRLLLGDDVAHQHLGIPLK